MFHTKFMEVYWGGPVPVRAVAILEADWDDPEGEPEGSHIEWFMLKISAEVIDDI